MKKFISALLMFALIMSALPQLTFAKAAKIEAIPGGIGVNFNEKLDSVNFDDMADTKTTWARGFLPYFVFKDGAENGSINLSEDLRIQNLKRLKQEGYKTIVSLKFNYTGKHIPTTQQGYDDALSYLETLLDEIYPYVDIIVSGNEPFIESLTEERNDILINFYKEITNRIHEYILKQQRQIPIYIGALNQMWNTTFQKTYHQDDYINYAKETSWIAGVDLHIHHNSMSEFDTAMNYASQRLRDDQKIIATEFSLMPYWRSHTQEALPKIMSEKYGYDSSWRVYQYINHAVKNRDSITIEEWRDFLGNCTWYTAMQDYLLDAYNRFITNDKFYAATYGMYIFFNAQNTFGPNNDPWLLNPLYASSTVQKGQNGRYQENYNMLKNFQFIQEMSNSDTVYMTGCVNQTPVGAEIGTSLEKIIELLPDKVKISTNKGIIDATVSKWETADYNPNKAGSYKFTAALAPADFKNPQNFSPSITVITSQKLEYDNISLPQPSGDDLWFKFDEPSGTDTATDSVNGTKATIFEAAYLPQGVLGGCVSFDGNGQRIQLGSNVKGSNFFNKGYTARTISFWFNPQSISGKQMLVETGGNIAGMGIRINNGFVEAAVNSTVIGKTALTSSDINRWKHIALSYNKGACKFYVDGKLIAAKTISSTQINDPANPSDIACNVNKSNAFDDNSDAKQYFAGMIDELRFYTSAVAPKIIQITPADKSALLSAVEKASAIDLSAYTDKTAELAAEALAAAQSVLKDDSAVQADIDNALTVLNNAIDGLVKKPQNQTNDNNKKHDTPSSIPQNGTKVINGKTVLYKNGKAVTGTKVVTVSKKTYAVVKGYVAAGKGNRLVKIGKKSYIVNKNGIVIKNGKNKLVKVGKKSYVVNKSGVVLKNKKSVKVGKKTYKINKKGIATAVKKK